MLKKLLYLYNDGHNPFPKNGKGGLGYHLPKYRLHGKGKSHPQDSDEEYEDTEGEEVQEMSSEEKDAREIYNDFTNPDGEYYNLSKNNKLIELVSAIAYLNGNDELQRPFLDLMNELKRTPDGVDLFYIDDEGYVEVNKDYDYDYDLDILRPTNEIEIAEKLSQQAIKDSMYELQLEELIDKRDILIKESREKVREQYIKEGKPSSNYDLAGKGYEYYLCNIALPLVQHITGDTSLLYNNDDNLLIPEALRKYSVVDLYNEKNIIECKDYNQKSSIDNIPIQLTKLLGYDFSQNNKQQLIFNENGNVIEMLVNGKNVLSDVVGGRKYYVYYRLDDGIYEYDVSSSIKKFIQKEAQGATNIKYAFDTDTIKSKGFKKIYGEIVKDDFNKSSLYLRKKYLKRITI